VVAAAVGVAGRLAGRLSTPWWTRCGPGTCSSSWTIASTFSTPRRSSRTPFCGAAARFTCS
jgi:hypothetical protein